MNNMDINLLIKHFQGTWYTELMVFTLNIVALAISTKRNEGEKKYFSIYSCANISVLVISWTLVTITTIPNSAKGIAYNTLNTLVVIIELFVYTMFFRLLIKPSTFKVILKIPFLIFLTLEIIFLITNFSFLTNRYRYIYSLLSVFEFLILIPPCLIYYYDLFNSDSEIKLFKRPSFWIITGIFFFSVISIPFYLLNPLLWDLKSKTRAILGILLFQLPIILNLTFLIKGLLCKRQLTT